MRNLICIATALLLTAVCNVTAQAQLLDRVKKKAQKAAERKAEEKLAEQAQLMAEQMVEKSWNSIFGEINEDSLWGQFPFTMNSNVETEELYNFDTITTMEIETSKKDGKSDPPVIMDMHFNKNELYTGTKFSSEEMKQEDGELFIIYDLKNAAMIMLVGNKDDKFSFAYGWKQALANSEAVADSLSVEDVNWDEIEEWNGYSKIESKNILGYDCDGYRSKNDYQIMELWVSRNADFGMNNLFKANTNAKQLKGKIPDEYPQGVIMEMISEDLQSGDKTMMRVTNIQKNAKVSYAMADYPKMSISPKNNQ